MSEIQTDTQVDVGKTEEDKILDYTLNVRQRIVDKYIPKIGDIVTNDPKELRIVMDNLDSMDRQALSKKKIKSDEGINDKQISASATLARILSTKTNKELIGDLPSVLGEVQELDDSLIGEVKIVPGELEQNPESMNYDRFMNKMQPGQNGS